jgi:hypothetical protein
MVAQAWVQAADFTLFITLALQVLYYFYFISHISNSYSFVSQALFIINVRKYRCYAAIMFSKAASFGKKGPLVGYRLLVLVERG